MKLTLSNVKEIKRNSDSPLTKRVCNYVIGRWSDYNDKKEIEEITFEAEQKKRGWFQPRFCSSALQICATIAPFPAEKGAAARFCFSFPSAASARTPPSRVRGERSDSRKMRHSPRFSKYCAFCNWSPRERLFSSGTSRAGFLSASSSNTVFDPARETTKSAAA